MSDPLVIIDGIRTPFCKLGSDLAALPADDLGRIAVNALLTRTGFDPALVDEVIFGCVCQPVDAANVARVIALRAGLPESTPAATVHRNCASGFEALTTAAERIAGGHGSIFIVGGAESMSQVPLLFSQSAARKFATLGRARGSAAKLAALAAFRPSDFKPRIALKLGLTDPISALNMGETAELLARELSISRERQDAFALRSHQCAVAARPLLAEEICPVYLPGGKAGHPIVADNGVRQDQSLPVLAALKPIFNRGYGSVTAGNSSQITDGAVALLVMADPAPPPLASSPSAVSPHGPTPVAIPHAWASALSPPSASSNNSPEKAPATSISSKSTKPLPPRSSPSCKTSPISPRTASTSMAAPSPSAIPSAPPAPASPSPPSRNSPVATPASAIVSACVGGGQGAALLLERV